MSPSLHATSDSTQNGLSAIPKMEIAAHVTNVVAIIVSLIATIAIGSIIPLIFCTLSALIIHIDFLLHQPEESLTATIIKFALPLLAVVLTFYIPYMGTAPIDPNGIDAAII